MRARGIVGSLKPMDGELGLESYEDVESFLVGDELYTRADLPELVALELKRRGKTSAVEGPFVLSESERGSLSMASRGFHDNGTVGALCRALERAVRTLGPQPPVTMREANEIYGAAALDHESSTAENAHTRLALEAFLAVRCGARLALPPVEPQPDAPTDIAALPDYWDERRRRQGKPDLSRCAAELRIALASSAGDLLTPDERACVSAHRHALEDGEEILIAIIDRLAPDPDPVSAELVESVCLKMDLTASIDRSFAQAVLEAAHALQKGGAK